MVCKYRRSPCRLPVSHSQPRNLAIGEDNRCFVELATRTLTPDQMQRVESECNEAIRRAVPMTPHWYPPGAPELEPVSGRGLLYIMHKQQAVVYRYIADGPL